MNRYAYSLAVLLLVSLPHAHVYAQGANKTDCPGGKCSSPVPEKAPKKNKTAKATEFSGPQAANCEQTAVSKKSGKKLSGAAKQKYMEKCMRAAG